MMVRNYSVYEGPKDVTKGSIRLVKDQLTRKEANAMAAQIRRNEKVAGVYRGTQPKSYF
jgi:hypothetical protein